MKKISIILAAVFLTACTPPQSEATQANIVYDANTMSGMPCHKMGNSYMGDCTFDEDGNPIME